MKVSVQYTAQLRTLTGRSEEQVELPEGTSLAALLARLAVSGDGEARPHLIAEDGRVRPSLLMAVNGAAVPARQAEAWTLSHGDDVTLMPPIAGG